MAHTPGEWEVHNGDIYTACPQGGTHEKLASVYGSTGIDGPYLIGEANAKLMASSPQLLEALKRCEDRLSVWAETEKLWGNRVQNHERASAHHNRADNYGALVEQARTAIHKATA